jgi:heme o synthase
VTEHVTIRDPRSGGGGAVLRAYLELTKPRIIELLLTTTLPSMIVAAGGWPGWWLAAATLIGGTLSAAGANTINQVIDADIDRIMRRTRGRPIPSGRVTPERALVFGIALGVAGFAWLWATTNLLAAVLSTAGLLFYIFVYTRLLKRSTPQNIVIGGAAGAVPVLVGWAAVTDSLALPALVMFGIVFFWTPPHFWALSLRWEDDYRAAGVPMLPVVAGVPRTLDEIAVYSIVTVVVSLVLVPWTGWIYLTAAVLLGGMLVAGAVALRRRPERAMRFFATTNVYLAGLFLAIAIDGLVN